MEHFYIIKLYEKSFTKFLGRLDKGETVEYSPYENDCEIFKDDKNFKILFVIYARDHGKTKVIDKAYACTGEKEDNCNKIKCTLEASSNCALEVDNLRKQFFLELDNDFEDQNYIRKETAVEIYDAFISEQKLKKETSVGEIELDPSKPSQPIIKISDLMFPESRAIKFKTENVKKEEANNENTRGNFEHDRDRIIHSKAFRRLVDKAQIFTSEKGDHYRTRMMHTLEVSQIARSIAKHLQLNEELTEAIALAHDIGHTPFGHQGERTLDNILKGKVEIIKGINQEESLVSGFKHNYQGLRVLSTLEVKYPEIQGLNLSYQVMEGVWKHTKIHDKNGDLLYNVDDFFSYPNYERLYPENKICSTLEGQVVAIADEIAQRSHDIDDAFKSHTLTANELERIAHIQKSKKIQGILDNIRNDIDTMKKQNMIYIDEQDLFRARLCSEIISYFVSSVIEKSKVNLENHIKTHKETDYVFLDKLVNWDDEAEYVSKALESLVNRKVINSSSVSQFDTTAEKIIIKLFEYYYLHPLTLPDNTLKRIYLEFLKLSDISVIDFRNSDVSLVRREFELITTADLEKENDNVKTEYYKKRKILARCIADHLGGMTDSYAIQEYHKLYQL